jgi:transcriptional regulator with XRE-family HTH domain
MKAPIVDELMGQISAEQIIFQDLYIDLVLRINQILAEKQIGRKELAELLGKKPSEISKWLNGEHNFTLKSIAKLAAAFDEPLIEISSRKISKKTNHLAPRLYKQKLDQTRNFAEPKTI